MPRPRNMQPSVKTCLSWFLNWLMFTIISNMVEVVTFFRLLINFLTDITFGFPLQFLTLWCQLFLMACARSSSPPGMRPPTPPPRAQTPRARQSDLPTWGIVPGSIINDRWIIGNPIGRGSFGIVYACRCANTLECCAIKVERRSENDQSNRTALRERAALLAMLDIDGFPSIRDHGAETEYFWSVITLLGSTLESKMKSCGGQFSLYTTVHIADQALTRIQCFHREGFIHRDIKPENFMFGLGQDRNIVFMCDFGLAKPYVDENSNHANFKNQLPLIGTMRFASTYNHKGLEQSRRDDLESWWFMVVYMLNGTLPWMVAPGKDKTEKKNNILALKVELTDEFLRTLPSRFIDILIYIRNLDFEQEPNYARIRRLLRKSLQYGFDESEVVLFDWEFRNQFSLTNTSVMFAKE